MAKILYTASTFSHIRTFHIPYLHTFREMGHAVHVAYGGSGEGIPASCLIELPFRKKMTAPENFRAAAMLRRIIREERYDLIITHTSLAAFFTRLAVKGLPHRPAVINMAHGYLFDESSPFLKRTILLAAERFTAPETDLLLTMNQCDYALAKRYRLGRRMENVPGIGVDFAALDIASREEGRALRRELGIGEDSFVFIYPAEFSHRKSQPILLRAMTHLPKQAVLVLPGAGDTREECRRLATELGIQDRVYFPGHVSPISRWYAMADGAVSASRSEGLPFNIMEAMYKGLPIVASAVKGHTDLLSHEQSGLLYPYGDSESCAQQMLRLMSDPSLCHVLGTAAREATAPYDLPRVLPEVMQAYRSLLP